MLNYAIENVFQLAKPRLVRVLFIFFYFIVEIWIRDSLQGVEREPIPLRRILVISFKVIMLHVFFRSLKKYF